MLLISASCYVVEFVNHPILLRSFFALYSLKLFRDMSGYNRFTALIAERDWTTLSHAINEADERKRGEMASQSFNGDLLLHVAIKLEAPKEVLLNFKKHPCHNIVPSSISSSSYYQFCSFHIMLVLNLSTVITNRFKRNAGCIECSCDCVVWYACKK